MHNKKQEDMSELYGTLCKFLTKLEDQYETFNDNVIIVTKGKLMGLKFNMNSSFYSVSVYKKFTINLDSTATSLYNLLLILYRHKVIEKDLFYSLN